MLRRAIPVCLLLLLAAGCAAPQTSALLADGTGDLPRRASVAEVPFYPQEKYYCGPASLAMVLTWSGEAVTQHELVSQVYTPAREGTLRADVTAAARRHGRLAVPVTTMRGLLAEIAAGHPVLVFQNLALDWSPVWHYAVAFGYDLDARHLLLRSGIEAERVTDLHAFERTWARGDHWALVVLPPEALPARAEAAAVLQGAAGLERAGRPDAAVTAYRTIRQRWPGSFAAAMGLGNALYATGDAHAAGHAFEAALALRPDAAAAWNNLAYALARQGRRQRAIAAAREALRLDPNAPEVYRDTLREVSAASPGSS